MSLNQRTEALTIFQAMDIEINFNIFSEKHDVIIGGLRRDLFNAIHLVQSGAYFQDDVILCVKQAHQYPQWTNVFFIVRDIQTWVFGFIFFTSGTFLLYVMIASEPKPMDAWKTIVFALRTMFGVPASTFNPNGVIIRLLYFATLYVQVLIVTIYNAYFFTFITRRVNEWQVSTIDELIYSNYRIYGNQRTIDHLNESNMSDRFAELGVCDDLELCLNQLQHQRKLAVAMSRLYFDASKHSNIHCFDQTQNLLTYSTVFMIRRDLWMYDELIGVFDRLRMSGLIPKWARDLNIHKEAIEQSTAVRSLQMKEAFGPFALCCIVLMFAFAAAIAEQIIFRQVSKYPDSRAWQIAEKCIDGKRHYMLMKNWNVGHMQRARDLMKRKKRANAGKLRHLVTTNGTRFEFVWKD